ELQEGKSVVERGGDFERWDLQVRGGGLGTARMRMAVEEHGDGKQLLLFRVWPRASRAGLALVAIFAALAAGALVDGNRLGAIPLGIAALIVAISMFRDCGTAMGTLVPAVRHHSDEPRAAPVVEPSSNGAVALGTLIARQSSNGSEMHAPDEIDTP